jgi:tetratricopeptide (TPR) repeat protein
VQSSANVEAIAHLIKGLALLKTLPDTLERSQQGLQLQLALAVPLMGTKGYAAPELVPIYARVRELSRQVGATPELGSILYSLAAFYLGRAELHTTRELGEQLFALAQRTQDHFALLRSHFVMVVTLHKRGEFVEAREHAEHGIGLYDGYRSNRSPWGAHHFGVGCLNCITWILWLLGYPDQALRRAMEALVMAQEMAHPMTLAEALGYLARFYQNLGDTQAAEERANAMVMLCTEQGFPLWRAEGTIVQGWVLVEQGQEEEGVVQIRQGLGDYQVTGTELILPDSLALLAAVYLKRGQTEEGLKAVMEALARIEKSGGRMWEAELYRLKGELTRQKGARNWRLETSSSPQAPSRKPLAPSEAEQEAEECFLKAIEIARKQQAKSLELRAVMSLVRLLQYQAQNHESRNTQHEIHNRLNEAHKMLSDVYNWFTEGFDTKDLQEAKALLEELS